MAAKRVCGRCAGRAAVALAVAGAAGPVMGSGTFTWNNLGSDATDPANWTPGVGAVGGFPQVAVDGAVFPSFAGAVVQPVFNPFPAGTGTSLTTSLGQLTIGMPGYTFSGNRLALNAPTGTLTPPITLTAPVGVTTFESFVALGNNQTWAGSLDPENPSTVNLTRLDGAAGTAANRQVTFAGGGLNVNIGEQGIVLATGAIASRTLSFGGSGGAVTVNGPVSNGGATTGGLILNANLRLFLNNTSNSFNGGVSITNSGGVLVIPADEALGVAPAALATNITFTQSGTLRVAAPETAAAVTLAPTRGILINNTGTSLRNPVLDVSTGTSFTLSGGQFSAAGSITTFGLIKRGAGTLNLTGAMPAMVAGGFFEFEDGVTTIDNDGAFGAGTVRFDGGTIAAAGGARTLANAVTLNSASTVGGALPFTFAGPVSYTGGSDRAVTVTNSGGTTFAGDVTISSTSGPRVVTIAGSGPVHVSGVVGETAGNAGTLRVTNTNGVTVSNGGNAYTGGTVVEGGGQLVVGHQTALGTGPLTVNNGTAVVAGSLATAIVLPGLTVSGAAGTIPAGPGTPAGAVRDNVIPSSASVDLGVNSLVVDYAGGGVSPGDNVRQLLTAGARGNAGTDAENLWGGGGITSSAARARATHVTPGPGTALGWSEGSVFLARNGAGTMFKGVTVDDSSVLVRYTYEGDADLDGVVDDEDVDILVANYQDTANPPVGLVTTRVWAEGDFNYDGVVNDADLDLMAATFGVPGEAGLGITEAGYARLVALRGVAVPEPVGVVVMGVMMLGGVMRRRRG